MADFSFSPIPLYGGFFSIMNVNSFAQAELSPGKYIFGFQQTQPKHLFAQVVNVPLVFDATPTLTTGVMRHVEEVEPTTPSTLNLVALSSSKAVLYYRDTTVDTTLHVHVLSIDGSDNITIESTTELTLSSSILSLNFSGTKRIETVKIDSTNFYIWSLPSSTAGTARLIKINVSVGNVVTLTSDVTADSVMAWNFTEVNASSSQFDIKPGLNAGEFIIIAGKSVGVINGSSTKITDLSDNSLNRHGYTLQLTSTEFVHLRTNHFLQHFQSGVWGAVIDYSAINSGGGDIGTAFRLDATHLMFYHSTSGNSLNQWLQMVRNLGNGFWEHQDNSPNNLGWTPFPTNSGYLNSSTVTSTIPDSFYFLTSTLLLSIIATTTSIIKLTMIEV